MKKRHLLFIAFLILGGCTSNTSKKEVPNIILPKDYNINLKYQKGAPPIDDTSYRSKSYNERVRFVVLHYTVAGSESSLNTLTSGGVSSHYLITDRPEDPVLSLVPEDKRAWHAGVSYFQGRENLNDTSIGIEIVNQGFTKSNDSLKFTPFSEDQMIKTAKLLKDIVDRYEIHPTRVVGHSDIAPIRKWDPGPLFPWRELHLEYGVGAWYIESDKRYYEDKKIYQTYSTPMLIEEFRRYGYDIGSRYQWDEKNSAVIRAFQLHFRPSNITGVMDLETFSILKALNKRYNN